MFGRQPRRYAVTSAVTVSVGVATIRNVSAPEARSLAVGPGITVAPPPRGYVSVATMLRPAAVENPATNSRP